MPSALALRRSWQSVSPSTDNARARTSSDLSTAWMSGIAALPKMVP
jgi:hypothetical protein